MEEPVLASNSLQEKLIFYKIPLLVFSFSLLLILVGLRIYFYQIKQNKQLVVIDETRDEVNQKIIVHITGGVNVPGVYTFETESRVYDVVEKAGGFSQEANQEWIDAHINLAQKLTDGMKLYVPKQGEGSVTNASWVAGATNEANLVSINTASQAQLEALAGIGPVTAGKIINSRPYSSLDELTSKKIISKNVFEKISDQLVL